ncbi:MAG: winged helix-turn-helix transcriptional regulator [Maritimibacter sp.]|nr:winged helix-turn-helix transcriptional regulator [Maritimibacter sp.]
MVRRAASGSDPRGEALRLALLRAIAADPDHSQRSLSRTVGVSLGAVNSALNRLVAAGLVETSGLTPVGGQIRLGYRLTEEGAQARRVLAPAVLMRQKAAHDALGREIEALEREIAQEGTSATTGRPAQRRRTNPADNV